MRLRKKKRTAEEPLDDPVDTAGTEEVALRRWWVPRVVAVALWAVIALSVVFAVLAWARPVGSFGQAPLIAGEEARWDVSGFAELFVSEFVDVGDGDEGTLAPFLGNASPASLTGAVRGEWFASSTTTTAVVETGEDRWRVTVAAALLRSDAESSGYVSLGVRFFEVEIVETRRGLAATGLPWITAAPMVGDEVEVGWGAAETPESGDALADTVGRFLNALLTGSGELGRYAAPGSGLRAVPATFDVVEVERMARRRDADGRRWVQASVTATSGDSVLWLTYELVVEERDGRWEIAAMGPTPVAPEMPGIPVTTTTTGVVAPSTQGDEEG